MVIALSYPAEGANNFFLAPNLRTSFVCFKSLFTRRSPSGLRRGEARRGEGSRVESSRVERVGEGYWIDKVLMVQRVRAEGVCSSFFSLTTTTQKIARGG